jgi:signal transduction histidine kinase
LVTLQASEREQAVHFMISDTGPGMSPEVLSKVGTPFFSQRQGGTGLGLAQCRRLIAGAGGQFEITSQEGEGTTVRFSLPAL